MKLYEHYHAPASVEEALALLAEHGTGARIIAGGTDLLVELDRKVRTVPTLIDITRIGGLDRITEQEGMITLGPLVTHNQAANSELILQKGFPLAQAAWEVGAPQLRNRGTVVGNIITASPANDTITPLMALGAEVLIRSHTRGERVVSLERFYTGFRKVDLQADEMVMGVRFTGLAEGESGAFYKLALRRAQAISVINAAVVLRHDSAMLTLGCVAPTIIRAPEAEAVLRNRPLNDADIEEAARLAAEAASPIDDVRGPATYRRQMVAVVVRRLLTALRDGKERDAYPTRRANLWDAPAHPMSDAHPRPGAISATINGTEMAMAGAEGKTLLRALRDHAHLTGTKEGCAEGECGACTIWLDGAAVMSCLVPAERAHGATITTIEGLSDGEQLHPMQAAFLEKDAVQCGYCTPGFIMSAAKLLDEKGGDFTDAEMKQAISGNLCRCTGYYKIMEAVRAAGERQLSVDSA
jgi:xanthine dehydrogenase iron-sulfur cluster and FAD-binding subunit A